MCDLSVHPRFVSAISNLLVHREFTSIWLVFSWFVKAPLTWGSSIWPSITLTTLPLTSLVLGTSLIWLLWSPTNSPHT